MTRSQYAELRTKEIGRSMQGDDYMSPATESACDWITVALIAAGIVWLIDQFLFGAPL